MKYIKRTSGVISEKSDLEPLYSFKNFPVFFGCVDQDAKRDIIAEMSWAICPHSGVIQLDKLIPLDILYQSQHVDGTGPTWQQYYEDFSDYIKNQKAKDVLEIGGGKGELAEKFISKTNSTVWTIVEPNPLIDNSDRIKVVSAFFDEKFCYPIKVDTVVFSQVWEHAYDPNIFIQSISKFLKPGGRLIFAYPNLKLWLKRKYTNAINFEHTMFLTDYFVDYLLKKNGFKIIDKSKYKDHSFFYTAERQSRNYIPKYQNKYKEYKKIFTDFVDYHQTLINKLNKNINIFDGDVYIFGAHIFTQYLLAFGLDTNKVIGLLDNSPLKHDKRLYGTSLKVFSPEILKDKKNIAVVLKVGIYRDEILKQIKKINPEVLILE